MENKNGQGIFYGVIGVATLIVAIIGATFAYFSASIEANGDDIGGNTNGDVAANLSLEVSKMTFNNAVAASNDLVPAILDSSSTTGINKALTAGCTNDGFTGCHVYKITASSSKNVSTANLKLDLSVTATVKSNWKYVVYTGSDSAASSITTNTTALTNPAAGVDIFQPAGGLTANTPKVWYLMIYLENVNHAQNGGSETGATSETGSYTGAVTLQAAGGQVKADFSA